MQPELEVGQSAATWLRDAGAAAVILILGGVLWAVLKKVPSLIPASHHNAVLAVKDAEIAKLERQRDEYKDLLFQLIPPLKKTLEDTRQAKRS